MTSFSSWYTEIFIRNFDPKNWKEKKLFCWQTDCFCHAVLPVDQKTELVLLNAYVYKNDGIKNLGSVLIHFKHYLLVTDVFPLFNFIFNNVVCFS